MYAHTHTEKKHNRPLPQYCEPFPGQKKRLKALAGVCHRALEVPSRATPPPTVVTTPGSCKVARAAGRVSVPHGWLPGRRAPDNGGSKQGI